MKVFLICPVRKVSREEFEAIRDYVVALELEGKTVHWPTRDTDQSGDGVAICQRNFGALRAADEVHVWWKRGSEGSVFDLGMAFALGKRLRLANRVEATPGKSFENVLRALASRGTGGTG